MALILRRVFRNNFLISKCETYINRCVSSETTSISDEARLSYTNDSTCFFKSSSYSPGEQQKILKVVNKSNLEELSLYEITQRDAVSLIKKRNTIGQFSTLNELVTAVNNIDDAQFYSLCDSVVHGLSNEGQKRLDLKWKLCYPSISEEMAQTVNSCVVLQINSEDVTWLHLSRSLNILQWEHVLLTNCNKLPGNFRSLELARNIVSKLPKADIYLMDDRKVELHSLKTAPVILRMVRLESMIAALLNVDYVHSDSGDNDLIQIESAFDETQKQTILKTLNECDLDELRSHDLAKSRAQNVLRYRKKNGTFKRLQDVLEVDGFGMKFLTDFCKNVVGDTKSSVDTKESMKSNRSTSQKRLFEPSLAENARNNIESVVSLQVNTKGTVWSHLDRKMNIIDMNFVPTPDRIRIYDHIFNMRVARDLMSKLPKAEAYLLEQHKLQQKTLAAISALRVIVQIESVLIALLDNDNRNRIFSTKCDAVGKFCVERFELPKFDGTLLLEKLLNDERYLTIDSDTWKRFVEQDRTTRNYMAASVLRSVAFYETEVQTTNNEGKY